MEEEVLKGPMMEMKDGLMADTNELQDVPPLDFGKSDKCVAVEWLLGKSNCTHINYLDLFLLFETTAE